MSAVKIGPVQKGVQIPDPMRGVRKYPISDLEKGDSFIVECPDDPDVRYRMHNSLAGCTRSIAKRTGRKFITRRNQRGIRVWRVA